MRRTWKGAAVLAALLAGTSAMTGTIVGRVAGPDGQPLAGARIVVPDLLRGTSSAKDGGFRIDDLPEGATTVTIDATRQGWAFADRSVQVPGEGDASLPVTLQRNGALARPAALHGDPAPQHVAQKQAYLDSIKPVAGKTPNILVVLFDDLGYGDLSSYGNRLIKTPNIDAAAARGTRLEQFYSAAPVCTPSRAGLLTGRYPTRAHAANHVYAVSGTQTATVRRSLGWANALPVDEILLPEVLARAGYATGAFDKWHLGDAAGHRPNDFGFQHYFGILYSNDMPPATLWRDNAVDTPGDKTDQATLTERITDEAVAFIRQNTSRPFFAYVPHTAPHLPLHPNPKHKGVSDGGTYGDVVEDLDSNVGRLLTTLRDLKLDDDTIVIIMSDNGGNAGGNVGDLRGRKGETFEGGQRVPALAIWPGVTKAGSVSGEMAMNIDIFPTLLKALDLPLPQDRIVDGQDLRGLLGGSPSPHDYLYYVTTFSGRYEAVRDRTFKYRELVENNAPNNPGGIGLSTGAAPVPPATLYQLGRDNEAHDVTARHPEEQARLKRQLDTFREEAARNPRGWQ